MRRPVLGQIILQLAFKIADNSPCPVGFQLFKEKKGPLTADQNNLMLPPEMPVDEAINDRCPPNDECWITMPDAAGSRRYPLAPALKSNGEKMLLFHIKKI